MTPRDFLFLPPLADAERLAYGDDALHFGDLRAPAHAGPHPLLLVIHGGFWRSAFDLTHMDRLCAALARAGIATYSIEYRRMSDPGGGWPGTFEDVRRAAHFARSLAESVGVLGFSAGGHLALRLAAECDWLSGAVGLAPVADLARAWELRLGSGVVAEFLGGSFDDLDAASPIRHAPRAPVHLVHGTADEVVPVEISRGYAAAHPCHLCEVEGANHFDMVNPESWAWPAVLDAARAASGRKW